MNAYETLATNRQDIIAVAAKHGAHNVCVFGSVARGEAGPDSDIDLIVDMEPGRSLLDLSALWNDLNTLLGMPVDVVTEKGLRTLIRTRVLKDAVRL